MTMSTKGEREGKKRMMEEEEAVKARMEKVKHKIMVMSGKGGVGKTTRSGESRFCSWNERFRRGFDGCRYTRT